MLLLLLVGIYVGSCTCKLYLIETISQTDNGGKDASVNPFITSDDFGNDDVPKIFDSGSKEDSEEANKIGKNVTNDSKEDSEEMKTGKYFTNNINKDSEEKMGKNNTNVSTEDSDKEKELDHNGTNISREDAVSNDVVTKENNNDRKGNEQAEKNNEKENRIKSSTVPCGSVVIEQLLQLFPEVLQKKISDSYIKEYKQDLVKQFGSEFDKISNLSLEEQDKVLTNMAKEFAQQSGLDETGVRVVKNILHQKPLNQTDLRHVKHIIIENLKKV